MKTRIVLAVLIFQMFSSIEAAELKLYTTVSPPYQQEEGNKLIGRSVVILNCIFDKLPDYSYKANKAVWKRVQIDAGKDGIDGWFGYLHISHDDLLSTHSVPISLEKWYWIVKKGVLTDVQSEIFKSEGSMAVLDGSYAHQWLIEKEFKKVRAIRSFEQIPKLLDVGRIEAALVDEPSFRKKMETLRLDTSGIDFIFLQYVPLYVDFTNNFLKNNPGFLDSFNGKTSECVPDVMSLSKNDRDRLEKIAGTISGLTQNQLVIAAVKEGNVSHAKFDNSRITSLDNQWRMEVEQGGGKLIDKILKNDLSRYLKKVKLDSKGLYSEIFVMDNKGLNVGQSDITTDYMQGDEAKFKETFPAGADAMLIEDIVYDDSSQKFQSQISMTIKNPADGQALGVITVGIDVEKALTGR